MQILVSVIDWEYPAERTIPTPGLWDLSSEHGLLGFVLELANGVILEMRVEAGSEGDLTAVRNLITGTGGGRMITLSSQQKEAVWLYQEGDDCYLQGKDGYMFVNPIPQPDKFAASSASFHALRGMSN